MTDDNKNLVVSVRSEGGGASESSGEMNLKKYFSEAIGTCCITYMACGTAAVANDYIATFLSFGFVVVAVYYAIEQISGCHINPAVSIAMFVRKKMDLMTFLSYVGAQVVGAMAGSILLGLCLRGEFDNLGGTEIYVKPGSKLYNFEKDKKDGWTYASAFLAELFFTFTFVFAVCGATDKKYHDGRHAGIVIGIALALIHVIGQPFTGPSVNPARSLAPAIFQAIDDKKNAIKQIWIYIFAPLIGGALSGLTYDAILGK